MNLSPLQKARYEYSPKLPGMLRNGIAEICVKEGAATASVADQDKIAALFPNTYGKPEITFEKGQNTSAPKKQVVGVILSGGQAPGGHNVISGLYDALKATNKDNVLLGFKGGPDGLLKNDYVEFDDAFIDAYRNTGGFDIIGSGRTKLETKEQFAIVAENAKKNGLTAVVIIGGDDSNTNAATLAEYMLWDNFYKEYHQDMKFDVLWGNDIISQFDKTPERISEDNQNLSNYNTKFKKGNMLSILKTYNNQDGEFHCIDQYPAQLGEQGALYKWAKYKLLPGGKFAQRPMMYVDGDESFTQGGIEYTIGEEVAMKRANNEDFYTKFDAIDRFVKSNNVITGGEAQIIVDDEDGYSAWLITREPLRKAFLVVSNHKYPTEKVTKTAATGESYKEIVEGYTIFDKEIPIPGDYTLKYEYSLNEKDYEAREIEHTDRLHFEKIEPSEFRIFELERG